MLIMFKFASFETVITSLLDSVPKLKKYRMIVIASLCIMMYLLGLPYCTRVSYIFDNFVFILKQSN